MQSVRQFGQVLHRLKYSEAIESSILRPLRVILMEVGSDEVADALAKSNLLQLDTRVGEDAADAIASEIALLKAAKCLGLRRTLAFGATRERSRRFVDNLNPIREALPTKDRPSKVTGRHVDFTTRPSELDSAVRWFDENGLDSRLLSNVRILEEGFDARELDSVCLVDTRRSRGSLLHAIGRVMQTSEHHSVGTVIVPLFVSANESSTSALNGVRQRAALELIEAVRALEPEAWNSSKTISTARASRARRTESARPVQVVAEISLALDEFAAGIGISELAHPNAPKSIKGEVGRTPHRVASKLQVSAAQSIRERGIEASRKWRADRRRQPLRSARIDGVHIGNWWMEVAKAWQVGDSLGAEFKAELAGIFNWVDLDPTGFPKVRTEMARLDDRDPTTQLLVSLRRGRLKARRYDSLRNGLDLMGTADVRAIVSASPTAPGAIDFEAVCCRFLMGGIAACNGAGRQHHHQVLRGFIGELKRVANGGSLLDAVRPAKRPRTHAELRAYGRATARTLLAGKTVPARGIQPRLARADEARPISLGDASKNARRKARRNAGSAPELGVAPAAAGPVEEMIESLNSAEVQALRREHEQLRRPRKLSNDS